MQVASQLAFLDFATFILMGECSWVRMRRCSARTVAANSKPIERYMQKVPGVVTGLWISGSKEFRTEKRLVGSPYK